jgi:hypothetical protein
MRSPDLSQIKIDLFSHVPKLVDEICVVLIRESGSQLITKVIPFDVGFACSIAQSGFTDY